MKRIVFITIFFLGLTTLSAQEALSLSDAIQIALANNYELKVSRNQEEISSINNTWNNTSRIPSVNFALTGTENFNINNNDSYLNQRISPDLSLNWTIFDGYKARINKALFEQLEKQSQGNTVILVESTIQDVILAYNNCLLQLEMVEVFKELAELSEDRYERSLDSKELGTGTTYESLQAKNSWLEDRTNLMQQQLNYDNSIRTLNFAMAVLDNKDWFLTTPIETELKDYVLADLNNRLLANNSTLKNQYLYQAMTAKDTELAQSSFMPNISLNSGLSYANNGNYYTGATPNLNLNTMDAYVGISFSYNLFSGGSRQRSVQIAKINEESAAVQSNQMEHSLNNQLLQIFSSYQVQKAVLELTKEQEETARLNLELSEEKLKNGTINSFNFRDIQVMYMNAAISRYNALYQLIQLDTDLLRLSGGIVEEFD